MNIDSYISHIKDVLQRIDAMFAGVQNKTYEYHLDSLRNQLNFILSHAESGKSFKQGLLTRQRKIVRDDINEYPGYDPELKDIVKAIYDDLDAHDYNVGNFTQEMSAEYFDIILEKQTYHENKMREQSLQDKHYVSLRFAEIFSDDLFAANYADYWIDHGIKKIQYFFLINQFSYTALITRTIDEYGHPDSEKLGDDILRIKKFYATLEAEGTHMDLRPVQKGEVDGKLSPFN